VIGRRLKYAKLITEAGSHEPPATGPGEAKTGKRRMRLKPLGGYGWNPLPA